MLGSLRNIPQVRVAVNVAYVHTLSIGEHGSLHSIHAPKHSGMRGSLCNVPCGACGGIRSIHTHVCMVPPHAPQGTW